MDSLTRSAGPVSPSPPRPPRQEPPAPQPRPRKILGWFLGVGLVFLLAFGGFLFYRAATTSQAISLENTGRHSFVSSLQSFTRSLLAEREPLRGEAEGRINILLLGRAGERYPGRNLTDTIMLASINTQTKQVGLLSLPRDLYAPIAKSGYFTKINSLYQYGLTQNEGVEPLRQSVETITGEPVHYFAIIDFDGFEKVVDTLDGVRLEVERDIYDTRYPGKNYSYETFELKKGWQTLDGKTALKYVRERHDDPEGDFGRAKRQQQVMQALKDQAFSLSTFFNIFTIDTLLTTLGESVKTDLSLKEIESLADLSQNLDTKNVITFVVDAWKKESLLRTSHVEVGGARVFILVPRVGNFSEIQDVAENLFQLDVLEERRAYVQREEAEVLILASPARLATARKVSGFLEEELGFTQVTAEALPRASRLENTDGESIIVDRAALRTPFSLDELLKRLPLERQDPQTVERDLPSSARSADLVIIVGESLETAFAPEANIGREELPLESEALPPQPAILKKL